MSYRIWEITVKHPALGKVRTIRGRDKHIVEMKAMEQSQKWDDMYGRQLLKEEKQQIKEKGLELAKEATTEAQQTIKALQGILTHTLNIDDAINWEKLRPNKQFSVPKPQKPNLVEVTKPTLQKPDENHYQPKISFIDKLFFQVKRKTELATNEFITAVKKFNDIQEKYQSIKKKNENALTEYEKKLSKWNIKLKEYQDYVEQKNAEIDSQKKAYFDGEETAIDSYCFEVLNNSEYPDCLSVSFDSKYQKDIKTCVVDYDLPSLEEIPSTKEVTYVISKQEFKEKLLLKKEIKELYENVCHQITIRTLHEIFEADVINAVDCVVFNGWVEAIDKKTGHDKRSCIMTVQADKKSFEKINLVRVAPDECFKGLKGISASSLLTMTPVAPIMEFDKNDGRFIAAHNVMDGLEEGVNLAAIGWEEFENLVRDIFEKEFSTGGGEVKVTQSSRDGGVDAIAFDPDPIKGGKIVIQAKRYTNVVGVSAVRDLYGVVQHEGATKGIIVTTSNYGPDAFSFAKDKPLTLLTGNHLLHLLEKHGIKASINLNAAKKLGKSMNRKM